MRGAGTVVMRYVVGTVWWLYDDGDDYGHEWVLVVSLEWRPLVYHDGPTERTGILLQVYEHRKRITMDRLWICYTVHELVIA